MMQQRRKCGLSCLVLLTIGWGLSAGVSSETNVMPRPDTIVTSDHLEMVSKNDYNHFYFTKNVEIRGNNLYASSDEMIVVVRRSSEASEMSTVAIGEFKGVEEIILTGNVIIKQAGREATSGKARILPLKEQVILSGNPRVMDGEGVITGEEMILNKNERRVIVSGKQDVRPTLTLPSFEDLSYQEDEE